MLDYYEIGQRIRRFRKAHDMSQETLAERVGISTTHMSHIETGNTKLSLSVLVQLATVLEVRTDDLLFDYTDTRITEMTNEIVEILEGCTPQQLRFMKDMIRSTQTTLNKYYG